MTNRFVIDIFAVTPGIPEKGDEIDVVIRVRAIGGLLHGVLCRRVVAVRIVQVDIVHLVHLIPFPGRYIHFAGELLLQEDL